MRQRAIAVVLALGILAAPLAADAQQPAKVPRIGVLSHNPRTEPAQTPFFVTFWQRMREHGWVEGRNLLMVIQWAEGRPEKLPALAAELVRLNVDVMIVIVCGAPVNAARQATSTIPIVVVVCNEDMVESGLVASLARPGGNITGLQKLTPELAAKRLQLLKEVSPGVSRVAVLWAPAYSNFSADWREMRAAARVLGVTLQSVEFQGPDDLDRAFSAMAEERADALITFSDTLIYRHRGQVADLAVKHRLPAMYAFREVPEAGGLMSYGPNLKDMYRRAADYVDKILRGAKPADLPVEQPTRFELVINMKTAKALGLTIPQSILIRADKVIE